MSKDKTCSLKLYWQILLIEHFTQAEFCKEVDDKFEAAKGISEDTEIYPVSETSCVTYADDIGYTLFKASGTKIFAIIEMGSLLTKALTKGG